MCVFSGMTITGVKLYIPNPGCNIQEGVGAEKKNKTNTSNNNNTKR